MTELEETAPTPVWCILANVVALRPYGPGGAETRRGIRLFGPGAKVWVPDGFPGMGFENVTVIGRTRHAPRYAVVAVGVRYLTNWRVKLVYSPAVLTRLRDDVWETRGCVFSDERDYGSEAFRDDLRRRAEGFQRWSDELRARWPAEFGTSSPGPGLGAAGGVEGVNAEGV